VAIINQSLNCTPCYQIFLACHHFHRWGFLKIWKIILGVAPCKKRKVFETDKQAGRQTDRQTDKGTLLPMFHKDSNYTNTTKHH
jgi:hypothetical protein